MKKIKIIYWVTTLFIFLFEGVVPALTSHTQMAVEGIRSLGYPDYFRVMLTTFKVAGAVVLIVPFAGERLKEWAYAGFAFNTFSAFVSCWVVFGFNGGALFPLTVLAIVLTSYFTYRKLRANAVERAGSRPAREWTAAHG